MLRGHEKCRVRPPWVDVEGVEPGPRLRDFGVDGNRWYVVHGGGVVGEWVVLVVVFMWLVVMVGCDEGGKRTNIRSCPLTCVSFCSFTRQQIGANDEPVG